METVGLFVQEAIDFTDRGLYETAFVSACVAISKTAKKAFEKENLTEADYKKFIEENRQLILFMGVPETLQEIEIPFELQKTAPRFRTNYSLEDFLFNAVHQTAISSKLPAAFTFNSNSSLETNVSRVLLPVNLISGLLASVIFHPANKSETILSKYWFRIADFKMFISELWGRRDLAERIMKFYLEREGD
jgi:hypothetical protein